MGQCQDDEGGGPAMIGDGGYMDRLLPIGHDSPYARAVTPVHTSAAR